MDALEKILEIAQFEIELSTTDTVSDIEYAQNLNGVRAVLQELRTMGPPHATAQHPAHAVHPALTACFSAPAGCSNIRMDHA